MKTVYKYPLIDSMTIDSPYGGEVVKAEIQDNNWTIWILVDTARPKVKRTFTVIGTGHPLQYNDVSFIDTIFQNGYVWHMFEVLDNK